MSLVANNKIETIEIPADYKNLFLKIIDNFSVGEAEKRLSLKEEEDYIFFSEEQEKELVGLDSYKKLKNTINNKFGGR